MNGERKKGTAEAIGNKEGILRETVPGLHTSNQWRWNSILNNGFVKFSKLFTFYY